jgi:hypothetical protein
MPSPLDFPDGWDLDSWAMTTASAWMEQSGLVYKDADARDAATGALERMLRQFREMLLDGITSGKVAGHYAWPYLRTPGIPSLPVMIPAWKQAGDRNRRLRLLSAADKRSGRRKRVSIVSTEHLGTGLRTLQERPSAKGRLTAFLAYAFRVAEHETDLQVLTSTDPDQLGAADDIERCIRGITVYRNTDKREVAEP